MTRFAPGLCTTALMLVLSSAPSALAQSIAGKWTVGLETGLISHEETSFDEDSEPMRDAGAGFGGYETSQLAIGLGVRNGGTLFGVDVGYSVAELLVVGLRFGAGWNGDDTEIGEMRFTTHRWSLALGPHAEFVLGRSWLRPFVGLELRVMTGESAIEDYDLESSSTLWTFGPVAGLHAFVMDSLAFDARLSSSFGFGAEHNEQLAVSTEGDPFEPMMVVLQNERDFDRFDIVLHVGISGWL